MPGDITCPKNKNPAGDTPIKRIKIRSNDLQDEEKTLDGNVPRKGSQDRVFIKTTYDITLDSH